ncbi:MAG: hypothetical protein ACYCDV_07980 [Facklamia hominis]
MKPVPLNEQETILVYDKSLKQWSFYSNNPTHIRRWINSITPERIEYHDDFPDRVVMLDGIINGSVSVRKKVEISEAQKQKLAERMRGSAKVPRQSQGIITKED